MHCRSITTPALLAIPLPALPVRRDDRAAQIFRNTGAAVGAARYARGMIASQLEPVVRLPNAPVLVAGLREAAWLSPSGEFTRVSLREAAAWVRSRPPLL